MHSHSGVISAVDDRALDGSQMDVDEHSQRLPDGSDSLFAVLGKEEERTLVRESTAGFAGKPRNITLDKCLNEPLAQ